MRPRSRPVSVQPAPEIFATLPSLDDKTPLVAVEEMEGVSISLPLNLEELTLERFDQLVESSELFYHPSLPEFVEHNGFKFEFHVTGALRNKPFMAADDPGRTKAIGPFVNPDPKFVITKVGPLHTLELSMYCVHRPGLVLHTNVYRPQTEALDETDIAATWAVLRRMETPSMILYNCGVEAGSSQGHKHLQVLPKPDAGLTMFPDGSELSPEEPSSISGIPFKHWALATPPGACPSLVHRQYLMLLAKTTEALTAISAVIAYNVVATKEWMVLIPRTHASRDGVAPANGASMFGLVWVADQEERDAWTRLGMSDHLKYLGIPR